jgi:hypothetical protein
MTSRSIIEEERHENLAAFEEAFAELEGVTEEHLFTLRRARTTTASASPYPTVGDPLGQAAYTAAALRGLAAAVATLQKGAEQAKTAS